VYSASSRCIARLPCRTAETLAETIKFDHGYTRDSGPAGHFVRVLEVLDAADQRRFLRFVTGSPRLPPGGIAALQVRAVPRMARVLEYVGPCGDPQREAVLMLRRMRICTRL